MRKKILIAGSLIVFVYIFLNTDLKAKSQSVDNLENKVDISQPKILQEQATIFYKNGNYWQALSYFLNLKENDLDNENLLLISNCYESLGDLKKASESLIKALEHSPKDSNLYYNLGILHYKSGNIDYAVENFQKAVKYRKHFKEAYYNLGNSYFMKENYKAALKSYKKAYVLDQSDENVLYNIALTYENLNNKKKSEIYSNKYKAIKSQ